MTACLPIYNPILNTTEWAKNFHLANRINKASTEQININHL